MIIFGLKLFHIASVQNPPDRHGKPEGERAGQEGCGEGDAFIHAERNEDERHRTLEDARSSGKNGNHGEKLGKGKRHQARRKADRVSQRYRDDIERHNVSEQEHRLPETPNQKQRFVSLEVFVAQCFTELFFDEGKMIRMVGQDPQAGQVQQAASLQVCREAVKQPVHARRAGTLLAQKQDESADQEKEPERIDKKDERVVAFKHVTAQEQDHRGDKVRGVRDVERRHLQNPPPHPFGKREAVFFEVVDEKYLPREVGSRQGLADELDDKADGEEFPHADRKPLDLEHCTVVDGLEEIGKKLDDEHGEEEAVVRLVKKFLEEPQFGKLQVHDDDRGNRHQVKNQAFIRHA